MRSLGYIFYLLLSVFLFSCGDNNETIDGTIRNENENAKTFEVIDKCWEFNFPKTTLTINETLDNWNDWVQFQRELEQKPKTTLLAFKMKIKNVVSKADSLHLNVPEKFNNPQTRSRLITLTTKINALETYMQLQRIPEKKVEQLVKEINEEINGFYKQLEEIEIKEKIPSEIGEKEMIKALDTTRMATQEFYDDNDKPKPEAGKILE